MRLRTYDVVVVGGGPVGATAAQAATENGADVLLIEKNTGIGRPIACTGLVSIRCFEESGASPDVIEREIGGAFIHAPDGYRIIVDGKGTKAFVIDRARFDRELLQKAEESGVDVQMGAKAVKWDAGQLRITGNDGEIVVKAKVTVGADGPYSRVAKWADLPGPQKMLLGIQAIIPYEPEREEFVEVFLGKEVAPNFFAWAVPSAPGVAHVGLGTEDRERARAHLSRFLGRFSGEVLEFNGGAIPIGPAARTVTDKVILVGDAAGQAKPTSGGGLYTGITCAKIAGEVAAKCALAGHTSKEALWEYERRWRSSLGRELYLGLRAHQLLCRLTDADLNNAFRAIDDPKTLKIISKYGDIDYPSLLAREFAKRPFLWRKFLNLKHKGVLAQLLGLLGSSLNSYPQVPIAEVDNLPG